MRFQGIATVSTSVNLTALPTIEEQATITKQDEDADHKHKSIAEVFPQQQQKEATQQHQQAWLPDGYSQIFRSYVFGPSGLKDYGSATLRCKI